MSARKIRVLIAKLGLDGHDRGAKVVARALRDAGMEVIYTGLHRTADEVVNTAIQEDVDVLGISSLSGAHLTIFPKVMDLLRARGADNILLVGGGIIAPADQEALKAGGLAFFWGPGTHTGDIVARLREAVK
jgi:methylmalonyl-CoA mutase C-terminal domain/subunit